MSHPAPSDYALSEPAPPLSDPANKMSNPASILGDPAPSDPASKSDHILQTVDSNAMPNTSNLKQKDKTYLCANQCSHNFQQYKHDNGIAAEIYTACSATIIQELTLTNADDTPDDIHSFISLLTYHHFSSQDSYEPFAFMSCNNKEDILTQSQMQTASDSDKFITSQWTELEGLLKFDVMEIHHISELPPKARLISSIWSYRHKCLPNGILLKHKSRFCVNGKEQELGCDYWETYAPVASWSTICLVMLFLAILDLKSRQVDYNQAFPQAYLDDPVFIKIPQGWYINRENKLTHPKLKHNDSTHYLRLKKNLYGIRQDARNWYKHLTKGLLDLGFKHSATDSCLYR